MKPRQSNAINPEGSERSELSQDRGTALIPSPPHLPISPSPHLPISPSLFRAWTYLVWLSIQRQARLRQMVGIALALLLLTVVTIWVIRAREATEFRTRPPAPGRPTYLIERYPPRANFTMHRHQTPRTWPMTNEMWLSEMEVRLLAVPASSGSGGLRLAIVASAHAALETEETHVYVFSRLLLAIFVSFLLPVWSLSFATNALGGEREGGNLVWLLTRPLPRWSIYLAKYIALLPWVLALNLGGFAAMCWAAGKPGPLAFELYWPAVMVSTFAFAALFHLMGAYFQRPAIVAIVYSFFLEMILGNMPGYLKRVSLGFYTRCMMFDAGREYGVQPEQPAVYLPVDGATGLYVLVGVTLALLVLGMALFSRQEYQDLA